MSLTLDQKQLISHLALYIINDPYTIKNVLLHKSYNPESNIIHKEIEEIINLIISTDIFDDSYQNNLKCLINNIKNTDAKTILQTALEKY